MALKKVPLRQIHKKLYEMTINNHVKDQVLFNAAIKISNQMVKHAQDPDILWLFIKKQDYSGKLRKIVNHDQMEDAESKKDKVIKVYVEQGRKDNKWFYLASSHDDCAKDHLKYQGRLYYDEKAPDDIVKYAKSRGLYSIQWVMGEPAWFITRPNCRHYFTAIPTDKVKEFNNKELARRYKTHTKEGNKAFQTPRKEAIKEYEDRLQLVQMLYNKHPTVTLKRQIEKIKILLKKWKNNI